MEMNNSSTFLKLSTCNLLNEVFNLWPFGNYLFDSRNVFGEYWCRYYIKTPAFSKDVVLKTVLDDFTSLKKTSKLNRKRLCIAYTWEQFRKLILQKGYKIQEKFTNMNCVVFGVYKKIDFEWNEIKTTELHDTYESAREDAAVICLNIIKESLLNENK